MGLNGYHQLVNYPELMDEFQVIHSTFQYISEIGYSTVKPDDYENMVNDIKDKQN